MVSRAVIDDFLAQKQIAIVGVSHGGQGFGNLALRELRNQGYAPVVVHPTVEAIGESPCFHRLADVPAGVSAVLLVTPPAESEKLVREAAEAGIRRVWLQQGAESEAAIALAEQHGMNVVHHECILMFAGHPAFVHRAHRFVRGAFGQLPA